MKQYKNVADLNMFYIALVVIIRFVLVPLEKAIVLWITRVRFHVNIDNNGNLMQIRLSDAFTNEIVHTHITF